MKHIDLDGIILDVAVSLAKKTIIEIDNEIANLL